MAKGPFRLAIEDWVKSTFPTDDGPGWWERVRGRWRLYWETVRAVETVHPAFARFAGFNILTNSVYYSLTGEERNIAWLREKLTHGEEDNVSQAVADQLHKLFAKKEVREVIETFGAAVTEPILTIFEQYAEDGRTDNVNPKEFARAFHGFMIGITMTGGVASTLIEAATAGTVKGAGKLLDQMYWSLGLGFLGWQTLAPLLSSGLQPGLDRYYRKLYRPTRFSAGELRDLFALDEIKEPELRKEAELAGWRDQDIDKWIKLAFRTIPQGDIFDAYHQGFMGETEAVKRLTALGFDPKDIPLLFQLNPKSETGETKAITAATARKAYRNGTIGETELAAILTELKYSPREIELIKSIEDMQLSVDTKELSVAQIKAAWEENVITDPEAIHWLKVDGLTDQAIDVLLKTWTIENEPQFRKLNIGTITGAYVSGVIDRLTANKKLVEIGLADADASLELDLAEARNPEAFNRPIPKTAKTLTPGVLEDFVIMDLITPETMAARLVEIGYTDADAQLYTDAARLRKAAAFRLLPQISIERAYLAGVIDRATGEAQLIGIGFPAASAAEILDTVERENPEAFGQLPEIRLKLLNPGQLEDLVVAGLIEPGFMYDRLIDLGYSEVDADLQTTRAVQLATPKIRVLGASDLERAYVNLVLDRTTVLNKLVGLNFTPDDAAAMIVTWEAENPAVFNPSIVQASRQPSVAALAEALRQGIITESDFINRATELGYKAADVAMYLTMAVNNPRKSTKTLSLSNVQEAYRKGLMGRGESLVRVTQMGYADADAVLLLRMEKDFIELTDVWAALVAGDLDPFDAIAQLVNANYNDKDIVEAFGRLNAATLAAMGITLEQLNAMLTEIPGGQ